MEINATNASAQIIKLMHIAKSFERLSIALALAEKYMITNLERVVNGLATEAEAQWEIDFCEGDVTAAVQRLNDELSGLDLSQVSVDIEGITHNWLFKKND